LDLARRLGYTDAPRNLNLDELGLTAVTKHAFIQSGKRKREGYGVLVAEMPEIPRTLASLGKSLRNLHDHPLAIIGEPGSDGLWKRFVVVRPRLVRSGTGFAFRTAKMDIDVTAPTRHDAEVLEQLAWKDGSNAQTSVDDAFDIEAITRKFFTGLRTHFEAIEAAIVGRTAVDTAVVVGVAEAGGSRRVAIRLISQILFCFFLQRKDLLAADRHYLTTLWNKTRSTQKRYHDVLEDLFYETLSKPVDARDAALAHENIPFLNGGLFERSYGDVRLELSDDLFDMDDGLLGFLTRWTFTLHEESPDESDVAIDPELLGRVFEHLVSDEEQVKHGVVYTPRPVVQFMCRESLVAWLTRQKVGLTEGQSRRILSESDPLESIKEEIGTEKAAVAFRALDQALARVTVLDPAVGSGAFLLGMLAEIIRVRGFVHAQLSQRAPSPSEVHGWKLQAIENSLFGVDIEPLALELCRLRLWLSLIVEMDAGTTVRPLPNLDYRTVAGNALTDFVGGVEVQNTRRSQGAQQTFDLVEASDVTKLRREFFETADPKRKAILRTSINEHESELVGRVFALAREGKTDAAKVEFLADLSSKFKSRDRVFPIFMPTFHFPETYGQGGWDIVIMNPPYLGRKEVAKRLPTSMQRDFGHHFGDTNDLLALFGVRMFDFVKPDGVGAMIGNDSFLTSTDATELRVEISKRASITCVARTNCFEGQAITGAVIVWSHGPPKEGDTFHWVEAYKRDLRDFSGATLNVVSPGETIAVGEMEVIGARVADYLVIPNRSFFRPSKEAVYCLRHYAGLEPQQFRTLEGWALLANTPRLKATLVNYKKTGVLARLGTGTFIPLGLCIDGGPGFQTGDDRRFLVARAGTKDGDRAVKERKELLERIKLKSAVYDKLQKIRATGRSEDDALLEIAEDPKLERDLKFPRLLRVVSSGEVFDGTLTDEIVRSGLSGPKHFIAFEKAANDRSTTADEGVGGAPRWSRENPIAIDWSEAAVADLRKRHSGEESHRRPRFQNEALWPRSGVTWNRIARYLRARLIPANAIFGDKAPVVVPIVPWLDEQGLLALLNSDTIEFILKTFLGSLMQIEVGDLRRLPIPVLTVAQSEQLSAFGRDAISLVAAGDRLALRDLENRLNLFVRGMYGLSKDANLWVTR
jgi:hypothetical protein